MFSDHMILHHVLMTQTRCSVQVSLFQVWDGCSHLNMNACQPDYICKLSILKRQQFVVRLFFDLHLHYRQLCLSAHVTTCLSACQFVYLFVCLCIRILPCLPNCYLFFLSVKRFSDWFSFFLFCMRNTYEEVPWYFFLFVFILSEEINF